MSTPPSTPPGSPPSSPRSSFSSSASFGSLATLGSMALLTEPSQQRIQELNRRIQEIERLIGETELKIVGIKAIQLTQLNPNIQAILGILEERLGKMNEEKIRIADDIPKFEQLLSEYEILEEGIRKLSSP
jgi:hypothetical protein